MIKSTVIYWILITLMIAFCVVCSVTVLAQPEPHLQPIDTELIQQYKDTIARQQEEIAGLTEQGRALRQERFELLQEMYKLTDGYLDRFLELLEGDNGI